MTISGASDLRSRWLNNSLVNLFGGLATAAVNLMLPALVAKQLSAESFSAWTLALQTSVYVNLLSLGLQTATARAVAHAEGMSHDAVDRLQIIVRAARSLARFASIAALVFVVVLVIEYPRLFPRVAPDALGDFRITLALFGLAAAMQIPAQIDMGIFQGLHRNVVFVVVQTAVRLATVAAVWVGVRSDQTMPILACLMAAATCLLLPFMRIALRHYVPWAQSIRRAALDYSCRGELLNYCGTLSVWSASMLLVNSVGVVIVGRIDFPSAGSYGIAMAAASVIVGMLSAALSPLLTTAAAMHSSVEGRAALPQLLTRTTLGVTIGLNLLVLGITALHAQILQLWVGSSFVSSTAPLLVTLISAHCLRNIAAPYALMLLATGMHRRALVSAIVEGLANLAASITFGMLWGAVGVALGSVAGSFVGIIGTLLLNTGKTPELTPSPIRFVSTAIALPLLFFLPLHMYMFHRVF